MRALLIAEKPSVMREIQRVYQKMNHPIQIEFASLVGHVVGLAMPEDYEESWGRPWKREVLPMIPEKYTYIPNKSTMDVYKNLKNLIENGNYDFLISATDAGREGELIYWAFLDSLKIKNPKPVKRFWASDVTDETIEHALLNLIDENDESIKRLGESARYRAYFDWLIGMNMSRAATIAIGNGSVTALGRVMTPTLAIIVKREKEILNFVPKDFFEIEADFKTHKGLWVDKKSGEQRILDKKTADELLQKVKPAKSGKVIGVKNERKTQHAPTLHSLLELQKEAGKAFGYTAAQVLSIAQVLYEEKKLLSYPRTESRHLPKNLAGKLPGHLKALVDIPELGDVAKQVLGDTKKIQEVMNNKKYVDDKKITDHHAILPTAIKPNLSGLKVEERNIYLLVVKRLLSIFLNPLVTDKTTVITDINGEYFRSRGQVIIDEGYTKLYNEQKKEGFLPPLKKGDVVDVKSFKLLSKKTTPPNRYDDPGLLTAMANAGNAIDDEELQNVLKESAGLGTSATRGAIIEKLIERNMIGRRGKSIFATDEGIQVIDILGDRDIVSAELTAVWEQKLRFIEDGTYEPELFRKEMNEYIRKATEDLLGNIKNIGSFNSNREVLGTCPKCQRDVHEGKNYYLCASYKENCDFIVGKKVFGTNVTKTDMKALLSGKETRVKKLTYKSGDKVSSSLSLSQEHKLIPSAVKNRASSSGSTGSIQTIGKCPHCGGEVNMTNTHMYCANNKECKFSVSRVIRGTKLSDDDFKKIIKGEETSERQFTWANGSKGNAKLKYEENKLAFVFS